MEVAYETVDNPGIYFKLRDVVDNSSEQGSGKVILTGTGGLLATRVKSVRFSVDFPGLDVDDKTVFREFDVEGAATAEASTIQILRQSNSLNQHFFTPRADDLINQKYRVYFSTVDSPDDYELITEVGFDAGASGSSKVAITDSTVQGLSYVLMDNLTVHLESSQSMRSSLSSEVDPKNWTV